MSQSIPIVTAYDTLGEEGLRHSLMATKAKAIFLEPQLLKTFINTLKDAKDIQYIIHNTDSENEIDQADLDVLKSSHGHLTLLSFEQLRRLGQQTPMAPTPPSPDDLCCIMYTSGTSGTPKGVELKHKNVVAAGMRFLFHQGAVPILTCYSRRHDHHCGKLYWAWRCAFSVLTTGSYL
jgi:long-chain acyl-CoA synthetase